MIRAFIGLDLPGDLRDRLAGVQAGLPAGRAVEPHNFHVTLVFLGEQPEPVLEDLHLALGRLRAAPVPLSITGLDSFGGAVPRTLHARVAPVPELLALRKAAARAAREAGIEVPRGRFVPHVTLARFRGPLPPEDRARHEAFLAPRLGTTAGPETVSEATLFRSHLTSAGAEYEALARYSLVP